MELILVRHAIAVKRGTPGYPNDDRPLTEEGIERMQQAAKGLAELCDPPTLLAASPLIRARQTAEIISVAMQSAHDIEEWPALLPEAAPAETLRKLHKLAGSEAAVLLVGHEPHLSSLTALALGALPQAIAFKKGGACALEFPEKAAPGAAQLRWFLTPKQLRNLS